MTRQKVVIYGACGALGTAVVKYFQKKLWWIGSIDTQSFICDSLVDVDKSFIVNVLDTWFQQEANINPEMAKILGDDKLDAIICVAGSLCNGNLACSDFIETALTAWRQCVWSSCIAASLSNKFLKEGGLLTLTGANMALKGTPDMIGYGMAKGAVHQLTKSLAGQNSGLPPKAQVISILPVIVDTPVHRELYPNDDWSSWTPPEHISSIIYKWITVPQERPPNGSLASLFTKNFKTKYVIEDKFL
ncbi:dihydropteridine reductase [Halyomorpha halys]|uniref:dihydropteridine reductase n=1 Tax=Halyomorpha halys TaxID=286706 RepID=UPI0006D522D3|nr:dihydropteridine reductase [Halyomorpha halys]